MTHSPAQQIRSALESCAEEYAQTRLHKMWYDRDKVKEALLLLPALEWQPQNEGVFTRADLQKIKADMLAVYEDQRWSPFFRIGMSHAVSFIDELLNPKPIQPPASKEGA